jgi:hypothetical protein
MKERGACVSPDTQQRLYTAYQMQEEAYDSHVCKHTSSHSISLSPQYANYSAQDHIKAFLYRYIEEKKTV